MVVIYDKVAKKSPQDKRVKWYVLVTTIKQVDDKEVVRLIADETSPQGSGNGNSTVAEGGDSAVQRCFSVKLGDWVSFFFTVNSDRVAKPEDVTANLIKQVNMRCRFGKEFKDSFERTEFVPVSKLQNDGLGYGLS